MNFKTTILLFFSLLFLFSCSRKETEINRTATITGKITVDPEIDSNSDYSGIQLFSTAQNDSGIADTLFIAITDSTGEFSGIATFPENDIYPMLVSRNQNVFGVLNMIFANDDTIHITGQIPDINNTVEIESYENEIYKTFERVDRGFNRVANFINAGMISADSIGIEIEKWSDIYWEVYDTYPETFAGNMSAETSISILRGWNDSLMVVRSEILLDDIGKISPFTLQLLVEYYAESEGLDGAIDEMDRIKETTDSKSQILDIDVQKIELLYDSSRTREANNLLEEFKSTYSENSSAMEWAENISYDLEFLTPGYPFPEFSFKTINGDSLDNQSLLGKPFLIEITRFENLLYQQQYDRTISIHQIYQNFDLEIITVPVNTNNVTLQAFFEERSLLWNIIDPSSFDSEELINLLNISSVPTRFLVDRDGMIVRRYVGNEYDDVVRGLQQIINQNE
ncbi:MAG: TlpA disulfide reductase family protein [Candidatus Paceibacterota bacterium]